MSKIYVVIKNYNDKLAKRQPWYSIKKLIEDLRQYNQEISVVSDLNKIPKYFTGKVIKVFSLRDIFTIKNYNFKLFYFITFPFYDSIKFLKIPLKVSLQNFSDLKRIFIASLIPSYFIINVLRKSDYVIVISDRCEEYFENKIKTIKYIPFQRNNWGGFMKTKTENSNQTIGYFGPPFSTRDFPEIVNFFDWLNSKNINFKKKIISRIDRNELKLLENKYLDKIKNDKNFELISGFLERNDLANELLEIDVLLLPFKIVMSELPVVVLEALELKIPVITTIDSGIHKICRNLDNIMFVDNFDSKVFDQLLQFIKTKKSSNFDNVLKIIKKTNKNTLIKLCQN